MKLFLYYSVHSFINQIKKLMRTWVAIFILICVVIGIIGGIIGVVLGDNTANDEGVPVETEQVTGEEGDAVTIDIGGIASENKEEILSLVAGALILLIFSFDIVTGDRNGSRIFLMGDVNLLFPSPMKPQSVLLFRLMCQMGTMIAASLYLTFQIPNLVFNMNLSIGVVFVLIAAWILTLITGKMLSVLTYLLCASNAKIRKVLTPFYFGLLGIIALLFAAHFKNSGQSPFESAYGFFSSKYILAVPFWGWIKGMLDFSIAGNLVMTIVMFVVSVVGIAALVLIIRQIKADYYEDAMARSEEMAALMEVRQSGGKIAKKRAKDRADKLKRDGLNHGFGANVYFYKEMYNRLRFTKLFIFTKTSVLYLIISVMISLIMQRNSTSAPDGFPFFAIVGCAFCVIAFIRSLGNPIEKEVQLDFFFTVPESAFAKVFWSVLAGSVNCLLDMTPAFVIACVLLRANPLSALIWLLLAVSIDFYSSNVGAFIDLSIATSVDKSIRTLIQIMFVYFGLAPVVVFLIIGFVVGNVGVFAAGAACVCIGIGFGAMALSQMLIRSGRK